MSKSPWYKHSKIFVPINLHDDFHWIAAVIDLQHKIITCYDSLQASLCCNTHLLDILL